MCCELCQIFAGCGQLPGLALKRRCYLSSAGSQVCLHECCVGNELLMRNVWRGLEDEQEKERGGREGESQVSSLSTPDLASVSATRGPFAP